MLTCWSDAAKRISRLKRSSSPRPDLVREHLDNDWPTE